MEQVLNENCEMLGDMSDKDVCVITKAWLSGALEHYYISNNIWLKYGAMSLCKYSIYRTKKKTIKIGDMEVPEPFNGSLKDGDIYYYVDLYEDDLVYETNWANSYFDKILVTRGLIHLDKESAIAHAKALIKVSGGEVL